jgi:hypothetical protein
MAKTMDMIGYCGLYCGSCPAYTQSIAHPAKELRRELIRNKCDKNASRMANIPGFGAFEHYRQFDELLAILAKMHCAKSCRQGGLAGLPDSEVREREESRRMLVMRGFLHLRDPADARRIRGQRTDLPEEPAPDQTARYCGVP